MKKLKYSFVAKVTAVFLYAFNIIGAFISGSFIVAAYILQFYKVPIGTYYEMAVYSLFVNGYYFQSQYDNLVSPQYYSIGRAVFGSAFWRLWSRKDISVKVISRRRSLRISVSRASGSVGAAV